jgi:hypothetical protein
MHILIHLFTGVGASCLPFVLCKAVKPTDHLVFLFFELQELYKDLKDRVNSVAHSGKIPEVAECNRRGFSEWNETITSGDHPSIVQVKLGSLVRV